MTSTPAHPKPMRQSAARRFATNENREIAATLTRQMVEKGLLNCDECEKPVTDPENIARGDDLLCSSCRGLFGSPDATPQTPAHSGERAQPHAFPKSAECVGHGERERFGTHAGEIDSSAIVSTLARASIEELPDVRGLGLGSIILASLLVVVICVNAALDWHIESLN